MTDWARAADRRDLPTATIGGADGAAHFSATLSLPSDKRFVEDAIPAVAYAAAQPLPTRDAQRCDGTGRPAPAPPPTTADVVLPNNEHRRKYNLAPRTLETMNLRSLANAPFPFSAPTADELQ